MQPRRGGAAHVGEALGDHLGGAREFTRTHAGRLGGKPLRLVASDVYQTGLQRVGDGRNNDQVTEPTQQVFGEAARILADFDHLVDAGEHALGIPCGEGVHDLVEEALGGVAEQAGGLGVADARLGGAAEELVEDRQRVADRPCPGADHQR